MEGKAGGPNMKTKRGKTGKGGDGGGGKKEEKAGEGE